MDLLEHQGKQLFARYGIPVSPGEAVTTVEGGVLSLIHIFDLVAMAGFGTILDKPIHDAYPDRIVNTHPALLPAFKGWHAVDDALAAGVKVTGCTVHLARLEVDDGPILAQESVPVEEGDTADALHERIKSVERRLYPEVLRRLVSEGIPTR